jgi:hypothetical protein
MELVSGDAAAQPGDGCGRACGRRRCAPVSHTYLAVPLPSATEVVFTKSSTNLSDHADHIDERIRAS